MRGIHYTKKSLDHLDIPIIYEVDVLNTPYHYYLKTNAPEKVTHQLLENFYNYGTPPDFDGTLSDYFQLYGYCIDIFVCRKLYIPSLPPEEISHHTSLSG